MNRQPQKLTRPRTAIRPAMLPLAGLALGMFTWVIDALVDTYVFENTHSLLQNLVTPDSASELWMRLLILVVFICMGFFSRHVLLKHITLDKLFLDYHKNLEDLVEERTRQLENLANCDPLTNLYNRRKFSSLLTHELQRFNRYRHPFSLISIDIDHFKQINDRYGHDTGDEVIKCISNILKGSIRDSDYAVRWGGEEFILLIIHATQPMAFNIAEKLRQTLHETELEHVGKITVSIGVTEAQQDDTESSIIKRSDKALYMAKNNGRNRIEIL